MTRKIGFPLILMTALAITPFISVYIPRFLAFWPFILGLGASYWLLFVKKEIFHISRLYYVCAGMISILCLLSVFWSISPAQSVEDALRITAMLMLGGLLVSSFGALEIEDFKPYGWLIPVGIIVAALLCTFDLYGEKLVIYKIFHHFDEATLNTSVMNRGIVCLVFAFFFTLPFIHNLKWKEKHKLLLTSITGVVIAIMLALSQSQSGQVAFALGLVTFFVFPARWRLSYVLFGIFLIATLLATPFVVGFLYENLINQSQNNIWLHDAYVGNRVEIWDFVMKYAMHNPLYGYGIEATNYVQHFDFAHLYNEKDTVLHPHNFSVQIWMEFGLFGVIIAAGILNLLLYKLYGIKDLLVRKSLTILFIVTLLTAAITYGLWQGWWIGEFLLLLGIGALVSNMQPNITNIRSTQNCK